MRFLVEIDLENDAFADGNRGGEIQRILAELADVVEHENTAFESITLYDDNGNAVGRACIKHTP